MTRLRHRPALEARVESRGELPREDAEYARARALDDLAAGLGLLRALRAEGGAVCETVPLDERPEPARCLDLRRAARQHRLTGRPFVFHAGP